MSEELFNYYEQELTFFDQMAAEFALRYPKVASRLQLGAVKGSKDPHVERMIDAFALLTARIRHKIDDEFPEVVESLLDMLYPHYLRPIPSMAVAQFRFEPEQSRPTGPVLVETGSLLNSQLVDGTECTFQTSYPVKVWPLKVSGASVHSSGSAGIGGLPSDVASILRIQIETIGLPLQALQLSELRFFLNGDSSAHYLLYELLFAHLAGIQVRGRKSDGSPAEFSPDSLRLLPVGFDAGEGILPYTDRSFTGYRLLQEYFHFPQKFFFFDLCGLDKVPLVDLKDSFEILLLFRDSELREHMASISQAINSETFQLGCTPIINLFERSAETIRVTHAITEHHVVPDRLRRNSTEVYSIKKVTSTVSYSDTEEPRVYEPFYSYRHTYQDRQTECFWYAHRRPSMREGDDGTEVYLSLVDLNFKPTVPPTELVTVNVMCTNRDFVSRLRFRRQWGELTGEGLPQVQIRCTVPPKATVRPPIRKRREKGEEFVANGLQWRLISHLSLNHLSIVEGGGCQALQEILRLYCFDEDSDSRKRIAAITRLTSRTSSSRVRFDSGTAFCRGLDVDIEFDEDQFAGSGVFLLASVLERFFGLYSAVNSYSRLTARTRQRHIRKWAPRAGEQRLL